MSTQHTNNPPVKTHVDGAVRVKVWRNTSKDNKVFYTAEPERIYTDPQTGEIRTSRSFAGTDIVKVQSLMGHAVHTIITHRQLDQDREQENAPQAQQSTQGLQAQRDAALNNAAPPQGHTSPDEGESVSTTSRQKSPDIHR